MGAVVLPLRLIHYTDRFDDQSLLGVIEVTVKLGPDIPG